MMDSNNPPCDERAQRSPSKAPAVRAAQEDLALISASANTVGCSVRAAHEATNGGFQGVWGFTHSPGCTQGVEMSPCSITCHHHLHLPMLPKAPQGRDGAAPALLWGVMWLGMGKGD